jgi:hypothetical protein
MDAQQCVREPLLLAVVTVERRRDFAGIRAQQCVQIALLLVFGGEDSRREIKKPPFREAFLLNQIH